jgi:hypothetical protein
MPDNRPLDGISLLPVIEGRITERPRPIAFESGNQVALVDSQYKLITQDDGKTWMLFDLIADASETSDIAAEHPDTVNRMRSVLEAWRKSCTESREGKDY